MKIRLTESKLRKIVNESIKNILKEYSFDWDRAAEAYYGDNEYLAGDRPCIGTYSFFDAIYNALENKYGEKIADEFYYAFEKKQDDFTVSVSTEGYIENDKDENRIHQLINSLPNKNLVNIINELIDEILNNITCDDLQYDYQEYDYDDDYDRE